MFPLMALSHVGRTRRNRNRRRRTLRRRTRRRRTRRRRTRRRRTRRRRTHRTRPSVVFEVLALAWSTLPFLEKKVSRTRTFSSLCNTFGNLRSYVSMAPPTLMVVAYGVNTARRTFSPPRPKALRLAHFGPCRPTPEQRTRSVNYNGNSNCQIRSPIQPLPYTLCPFSNVLPVEARCCK